MSDNYDDDWVWNGDCAPPPLHNAVYYDTIILPQLFYKAVIERNKQAVIMIIKYNIALSLQIVSLFDISLKGSFFYKLKWLKNSIIYNIK